MPTATQPPIDDLREVDSAHTQRQIRWAFRLFAGLLGLIQVYRNRFSIWTDGVSYLDIADAYQRADWQAAVNACWSPLYSWLLALALQVLHPTPYWELAVVKATGFGLFIASLLAFEQLLAELMRARGAATAEALSDILLMALGYTVFLWCAVDFILIDRDAPDMLVATLVYAAAATTLRILRSPMAWSGYALLGALLGAAYLAKSSMLPLAPVFLGAAVVHGMPWRRLAPRLALAVALLLLLAAPWIGVLSLQKERLTFGDAGRLNYAWYISPYAPDEFWRGQPAGSGTPVHPVRQILQQPQILEFAAPVAGSYPPWYDPSYWNEGLQARFDPMVQFRMAAKNLFAAWDHFLAVWAFALLVAVGMAGRPDLDPRRWRPPGRLMWPALAGLGGYMVFTSIWEGGGFWGFMQLRYFAPFVVLLFAASFCGPVFRPVSRRELAGPMTWLTLAAVACTGLSLLLNVVRERPVEQTVSMSRAHVNWQLAEQLQQLGVRPNDRVALAGHHDHYHWEENYWARLARLKIVASVSMGYWSSSPSQQAQALEVLRQQGVRALIQPPLPSDRIYPVPPAPWIKLEPNDAYVLLL